MFDLTSSIDNDLRRLRLETDQLGVLISMLSEEPAEVRDVWHWQWQRLMQRVEGLHRQRRDGHMSDLQARELLELSRLLQHNRGFVEALGCQLPTEVIEVTDGEL